MLNSPMEVRALQVLIIARVKAYRDALVAALRERQGIAVSGQALELPLSGHRPNSDCDVIIVDVSSPTGLETIAELRSTSIPIIAIGVGSSTADVIGCAMSGAAGFASADASIDEIVETMNDVVQGKLTCSPRLAFHLFRKIGSAQPAHSAELTPREQEVLHLISDGLSNKEIASHLGIAVSTVKNHVHHILEKSEVCSRKHAARKSPFMLASQTAYPIGQEDLVPPVCGI